MHQTETETETIWEFGLDIKTDWIVYFFSLDRYLKTYKRNSTIAPKTLQILHPGCPWEVIGTLPRQSLKIDRYPMWVTLVNLQVSYASSPQKLPVLRPGSS